MAESCTSPRTRPSQRWFSRLGVRQTQRTKTPRRPEPKSLWLHFQIAGTLPRKTLHCSFLCSRARRLSAHRNLLVYHFTPCPPRPWTAILRFTVKKAKFLSITVFTTFIASKPIQYEERVTNKSGPTRWDPAYKR